MRGIPLITAALLAAVSAPAAAQGAAQGSTVIDSIAVVGAHRVPPAQIISSAGIPTGKPVTYLDVQRAIRTLFGTGQFSDVRVSQGLVDGKDVLRITVVERPMLTAWSLRGVQKLAEHSVRSKVKLVDGRPFDPAAAAQSVSAIDSLYLKDGYYLAHATLDTVVQPDGSMHAIFDVTEGNRVAISEVIIKGNTAFTDKQIVAHMKTGPEGFWWFQRGQYDEGELERDIEQRLPDFYAANGYIDFHVVNDTLIVPPGSPKGILELTVQEGPRYVVGNFDILGNSRFSTQDLDTYYPFTGDQSSGFLGLGGTKSGPVIFSQSRWDDATQAVGTLYQNNGYLYSSVDPEVSRRVDSAGDHIVDLRWQISEGQPATINRVEIRGNTITHEGVIRRATLPLVPGDVFRQNALIQAYRSVSNLGFFQQPLDIPKILPANDQGDVNVVFNVQERHTGSVNFGASVGQGTGLGGFIGLDEPNVFGRGKKVSLQWQFGQNISQFNVGYTDPAIRGGLMSGSISLQSSTLRYTIADLGQIRTRGGTVQLGFPFFGSRYTRILTSYTLNQNNYDSPTLSSRYFCRNCILSSAAVSLVQDTRYNLPFPTGGSLHSIELSQNGGFLGGSGNFQRLELEGRWYAPLAELGGSGPAGGSMTLVLALKARSGFVWGNPGPNFQQLFAMGGTQYGIPLRGYDEFSITPNGFDPNATGNQASTVNAFGQAYFSSSAEIGLRLSQALYVSTFFDAGNVWAKPSEYDPTHLFRGAGIGVSVVSPLGPLGIDYAYGFDRTDVNGNPAPGWKLHFKIGNFF